MAQMHVYGYRLQMGDLRYLNPTNLERLSSNGQALHGLKDGQRQVSECGYLFLRQRDDFHHLFSNSAASGFFHDVVALWREHLPKIQEVFTNYAHVRKRIEQLVGTTIEVFKAESGRLDSLRCVGNSKITLSL